MINPFRGLTQMLYNQSLKEEIKEEVADDFGISPEHIDVPVAPAKLPFYHGLGKVLGSYIPKLKRIFVDLSVYFGRTSNFVKTLAHEYAHGAQDYLGTLQPIKDLSKYLRGYRKNKNELEAREVADRVDKKMRQRGKYSDEPRYSGRDGLSFLYVMLSPV